MYHYIVTAPGQGVQRPGMLDPWLDAVPGAPGLVDDWSRAAGFDLIEAGRNAELLADTAYAQPLIVATALLSYELLRDRMPLAGGEVLFAGHSVGELAAASAAGYLGAGDAVALARVRGAAMSAACAAAPTAMAAVMPTRRDPATDEEIVAAVEAAGLTAANWNGSHQFVAAGPAERIAALVEAPPPGVRVARLAVAGAFHTAAMAPAVVEFARAVGEVRFTEPSSPLLGNADGAVVNSPDELRRRLITQITAPVRWDRCARTIATLAPDAPQIELAPAGPLTRLLQRDRPAAHTVALSTPQELGHITGAPQPAGAR
ncbi:ACP S-malonyltransferase [Streptomyces sp. NPDC057499]|uniref:ACP S-malonyltransferase n=1 Tax=Streptomyces sp. NPDC057499 TaxID=3346150 RepID=UPI00367F96B1